MGKRMNLKNKKKKRHIIKKTIFIIVFLFSCFFTIRLLASISIENQSDEFLTRSEEHTTELQSQR